MVVLSPSRPASRPGAPDPSVTRLSAAEQYAQTALQVMERESLLVDEATWPGVVADTMAAVRSARSTAETYGALSAALDAVAGYHGRLLPPAASTTTTTGTGAVPGTVSDGIGLIVLPGGSLEASDREISIRAASLARGLSDLRGHMPCGLIVDLRGPSPGADWGGLAGLTSLIPEGPAFFWLERDGKLHDVSVAMGGAFLGGKLQAVTPQVVPQIDQPVYVLQDARTGAGGESLILALRGNPHVTTVGETTSGAPLLESFQLSDGARIVLPRAQLRAVGGKPFPSGLEPDQHATSADSEAAARQSLLAACQQG